MRTVFWEVQPLKAPAVSKYCQGCGTKKEFISSGLFRVNAQQRNLDIWLVYNCSECKKTWNMSILSRVMPGSLPVELLEAYTDNDPETALGHACDAALIKRSGAEPGEAEYEVIGEKPGADALTELIISTKYKLDLKLSALLRRELGLSRGRYDRLCDSGAISSPTGQNPKKCSIGGGITLMLDITKITEEWSKNNE